MEQLFERDGQKYELHFKDGFLDRGNDLPAVIITSDSKTRKEWWSKGKRTRTNGPSVVVTDSAGAILRQEWWRDGLRHNSTGPAVTFSDGRTMSFYNGRSMSCRPQKLKDDLVLKNYEFMEVVSPRVHFKPDGTVERRNISKHLSYDSLQPYIEYYQNGSISAEKWVNSLSYDCTYILNYGNEDDEDHVHPTIITYYPGRYGKLKGNLKSKSWLCEVYTDERFNICEPVMYRREDGLPQYIEYYDSDDYALQDPVKRKVAGWYTDDYGPTKIQEYDQEGNVTCTKTYRFGELCNPGGPDVVRADGTKEWYSHGEYGSMRGQDYNNHDTPSYIGPDGTLLWYQGNLLSRDNKDLPVGVDADGTMIWAEFHEPKEDFDLIGYYWKKGDEKIYFVKDGKTVQPIREDTPRSYDKDGNIIYLTWEVLNRPHGEPMMI